MKFGIRSVSMDDIANNLGMSKKTLYQYFADKDELVEAVVDGHITIVQGDCINCKVQAKDAIHEIFLTMEHIMQEFSNMNPMLVYDLEKFHFKATNDSGSTRINSCFRLSVTILNGVLKMNYTARI